VEWSDPELARILILDGHNSAALAFTRSAGRAGHWVAVGANRGLFAPAKLSRYCQLSFEYPISTDHASDFVDSVLAFARAHAIDLVIPIADWTLQPLSEQRSRFAGICRLGLPPHEAVLAAADKYRTVELAQTLGIATPRTWLVRTPADLNTLPTTKFPLVIKDRFSVRWIGDKAVLGTVGYAFSPEELERTVKQRLEIVGDVLVQEFVFGAGIGFSFLLTAADAFLPFAWERIREVDPRGSASSCRKSIPLDENLAALSRQLVRDIGFQGIAMVEYKRVPQGPPMLMEINGRPWGSIALPIASGIDYPRYVIDWWLNGTLPPQNVSYQQNIVCRRLVGELTHLSNVRKGKPAEWPSEYPAFWSTLAKVAVPWYPGMYYDDLWLSDPRPAVEHIRHWFRIRRKH
jgi:predicted ATP-grasp superfamily ATP-dependent carboligase